MAGKKQIKHVCEVTVVTVGVERTAGTTIALSALEAVGLKGVEGLGIG